MPKLILFLACLLALLPAFAQSPQPLLRQAVSQEASPAASALTKFSLDFPGGTPKQLVAAIEKAMGKPLNAIIPNEHADIKLPPLKMSNVEVPQLFQALELVSQKTESYVTGSFFLGGGGGRGPNVGGGRGPNSSYQQMRTSYGFKTSGPLSNESIWYFYVEKPTLPPPDETPPLRVCRYFSLTPYLERNQTVDDITTAIQTGWKMLGEDDTPKISFHKETQLLIAVGEPGRLETIDAVLQALTPPARALLPPPTPVLPVSPTLPQRAIKSAPVEMPAPATKP